MCKTTKYIHIYLYCYCSVSSHVQLFATAARYTYTHIYIQSLTFLVAQMVKKSACNADLGLIPG